MTRAEVLAEYLNLTPETHPDLYRMVTLRPAYGVENSFLILALPDPLAPGTEADAWLGVLVRSENFKDMHRWHDGTFSALTRKEGCCKYIEEADPTPAIVRAMMAADSTFAAKMEGAEG